MRYVFVSPVAGANPAWREPVGAKVGKLFRVNGPPCGYTAAGCATDTGTVVTVVAQGPAGSEGVEATGARMSLLTMGSGEGHVCRPILIEPAGAHSPGSWDRPGGQKSAVKDAAHPACSGFTVWQPGCGGPGTVVDAIAASDQHDIAETAPTSPAALRPANGCRRCCSDSLSSRKCLSSSRAWGRLWPARPQ
jgi:hypothetical protein